MRLLVTGGCGFIGSNAIRRILKQPELHHLVNLDSLTYAGHPENLEDVHSHPKYSFEWVDLRHKEKVYEVVRRYEITHVLHLAAESHVDRSISSPDDFIHTNVLGTFHLLEACREMWLSASKRGSPAEGQFRFHHVSTDEVYGSLGAEGSFTEDTPYAPNSPYAASKASSDMLVRAYYHTYGLPTVITNCSNNYGPYQFPEKLIPLVIHKAVAGEKIPVYGDGMNVRDWLHVGDHIEALWLVLRQGRIGQTYNIGGGNAWPNLKVVERVCDLVDELRHSRTCSRQLITFVADRLGHDRRYSIDAAKIRRELCWSPKYDFDRGLRETVRWYLENSEWVRKVTTKPTRVSARE